MELTHKLPPVRFDNSIQACVISSGHHKSTYNTRNLVTNIGQTAYIDGGFPNYIALGVGAHSEVPTVNALDKFSVMVSGSWTEVGGVVVDVSANTISRVFTMTKVFPVEKANKLYSEIGIVNDKRETYTYARLRDSSGQPTTITVLKDEQLEVTYTFRVVLPYKHEDKESGYTCYIHNIPAPHRVRNAIWTSSASQNYFKLFEDALDRLEAGLAPTSFSGSRSNGYYHKRNNKIGVSVPTAIGQDGREYTGVYCIAPYEDQDYSFSILFDKPTTIDKDALYEYSITLPYLKD